MKLQNKLIFAVGAAVLATSSVSALDFDLRHEYRPGSAKSDGKSEQSSRFKFGHTFKLNGDWKSNLSLETKFKSENPDDFMEHVYINEMEVDMGLTYNLGGGWELKPGMPINVGFEEPGDSRADGEHLYRRKTTYKPQVRIQNTQKFEVGKLKTALRYRHEIADYRNNQTGDTAYNSDGSSHKVTNPQTAKITLTGAFTPTAMKKLYFAWEANYVKSYDDVKKGIDNDQDHDWDAGVFLGYRVGNFRPYVEAWNIKGSGDDNRRSAKYRVGLKYYWK